jgi:hypothetical protein
MNDHRIGVVLREKVSSPRAWRRCWEWLKANFPLVTRSGGRYAEARVAQEEAKARLIGAQADVDEARAEQIRAQTSIMLRDLDQVNADASESMQLSALLQRDEVRVRALEELNRLLENAQRLGIRIAIEQVTEVEPLLLARPDDAEADT